MSLATGVSRQGARISQNRACPGRIIVILLINTVIWITGIHVFRNKFVTVLELCAAGNPGSPLLGELEGVVRAKRPARLPAVLDVREVGLVLGGLGGVYWLAGCLLYGSGLRLMEALRLRVKDLDFARRAVIVRDGTGRKDRVVTLADEIIVPLSRHLDNRRTIFERDKAAGTASVYLPYALARKYPIAETDWGWQYVFPSGR